MKAKNIFVNRMEKASLSLLFISTLLAISSCTSKVQEGILADFTEVEYLTVKDSIDLEELDILRPLNFQYNNGMLIFHTVTGWQELQFLDLKDFHVSTKQFIGQGPDEVTTYTVVENSSTPEIHLTDPNTQKILTINLDTLRADDSTMPRLQMSTPERKRLIWGFENDRYMYFRGYLDEGRFMCYDKQTQEVKYYGDYPDDEAAAALPPEKKQVVFVDGQILGNQSHLVAMSSGYLDFYEIGEHGKLTHKRNQHYFFPRFTYDDKLRWSDDDKVGFTIGSSNDDFVYFLYNDQTFKESMGSSINNCSYLMAYDWDGNPACEYHLEKPLWDIAINDHTIYGLSREKEAIVYIYELPD